MTVFLIFLFTITTMSALFVTIGGEWLIGYIPAVRQFREAHKAWGGLRIQATQVFLISEVVQRRFEELSDPSNDKTLLSAIQNKRFGDVVTIVSYKDRDLRDLTTEIRAYCAIYLVLLAAGIALNGADLAGKSLAEGIQVMLSYHIVPILESVMLVYLAIRLVSETRSLKYLLSGE
jgi:hypothetical protein